MRALLELDYAGARAFFARDPSTAWAAYVAGVFVVLAEGPNAGGEAGHLGGALAGFLLWKIPVLRGLLGHLGRSGQGGSKKRPAFQIRIAKREKGYQKKLRPQSTITELESNEVDRILDKINEHGLQSLTGEERELLARAGKK